MRLTKYITLFLSTLQLSAMTFGGGYAAMPLIQQQVVELHPWLTMAQFADIMAIAEMTPGPIAINAATFVGMRVAGLPGAVIATVGCVLPGCVIVLILAFACYRYKGLALVQGILAGLRPAVVAMIASAGLSLMILALYGERVLPDMPELMHPDLIAAGIFVAALCVLRRWKRNPIWVMLGAGMVGILLYALFP